MALPVPMPMFTRLCAALSKASLMLAVAGLIAVILCVQAQVVGRYVFNDTPTWAEVRISAIVDARFSLNVDGVSARSWTV